MPDSLDYLQTVHDDRNRALAAARSILDRAAEEGRSNLTGEEELSYKRATDEYAAQTAHIDDIVDSRAREAEFAKAREGIARFITPDTEWTDSRQNPMLPSMRDLEAVFEKRLGVNAAANLDFTNYRIDADHAMPEVRSIYAYAGAGTLGGLAPTLTDHSLYQVLVDQGAIWQMNCDIKRTAAGNPVRWPKAVAYGTATVTAEGVALTESDATLGSIISTPVAYKHMTKVSYEMIQDAVVDVADFVAKTTSIAMSKSYGPAFATGSGTGEPQGYMTGGSITVSAAGTASPDTWIRLQHTVSPPYRRNGRYVTNDGNASYLRRLRADVGGTTGPWLMSPPSTPGGFETAFGAPVIIDNNIPVHGSAVKSLAFGDFNSGYLIHDAGFRFERSDEAFFANDLVGFRGVWRLDGRVRDVNAYGVYQATAN
jgi:HK97 family phage major capsid protein